MRGVAGHSGTHVQPCPIPATGLRRLGCHGSGISGAFLAGIIAMRDARRGGCALVIEADRGR